jgi:hypothetical protein
MFKGSERQRENRGLLQITMHCLIASEEKLSVPIR